MEHVEDRGVEEHEAYIPKSLELARKLEHAQDDEEVRARLGDLLDSIATDIGAEFTSHVAPLYHAMHSERCLARVESLSRVLEAVELGKPLHISDETDSHYANAVVPVSEGIKIAFGEGEAPGPVRVMVGFGKTLIGFKTDHLSVSEIDFSESEIRDARERKYLCRHVSGDLKREDIRYLILRIPYAIMDPVRLTDEERKRTRPFVFRGVRFGSTL